MIKRGRHLRPGGPHRVRVEDPVIWLSPHPTTPHNQKQQHYRQLTAKLDWPRTEGLPGYHWLQFALIPLQCTKKTFSSFFFCTLFSLAFCCVLFSTSCYILSCSLLSPPILSSTLFFYSFAFSTSLIVIDQLHVWRLFSLHIFITSSSVFRYVCFVDLIFTNLVNICS